MGYRVQWSKLACISGRRLITGQETPPPCHQIILIMKEDFDLEEFAYSHNQDTLLKLPTSNINKDEDETIKFKKTKKHPKDLAQGSVGMRQATLEKILGWRRVNLAVVDTMGCERLADPQAPLQIQKYQTLISLMLSIQTKDQTTSKCVERLKQYGLTPQAMSTIPQEKLVELIYECNFNKRKAKNIIQVSNTIFKQSLARTTQQLMAYAGVGVKIAMIYMNVVEGVQEGIGVDTHVHRISNRLGWVKTEDPNNTEKQLQIAFHKKWWKDMNIALVGFGQLICNAKKPLCSQCPVSKECPSSSLKW